MTTPQFLTPEQERELKVRMGIDPEKPFDPSAPIPVKRTPSEAIETTHEEVMAQLGAASDQPAKQEKNDGEGNA